MERAVESSKQNLSLKEYKLLKGARNHRHRDQDSFRHGLPKVSKQESVLPTLILSWAILNGEIRLLRNSLMSLKLLRPMLQDPSTSRTISVIAGASH